MNRTPTESHAPTRRSPRTALPLAALVGAVIGCGSSESGQAVTTATATTTAAPATTTQASATATASAAPGGADLDKREMSAYLLDTLKDELPGDRERPKDAPTFQKLFRQVGGGKQGYCGAHSSGNITCWGRTPVDGMAGAYAQVAVADNFVCAVDLSGAIRCLPEGAAPSLKDVPFGGQMGSPPTTATASASADASGAPSAEPAPAEVKYKSVVAGPTHVCAIDREGHLGCWGDGRAACQIKVSREGVFRTASVGSCHVCARDNNEHVKCWGDAATSPPADLVAKELVSGNGWSCALDPKGALVCWGTPPAAPADLPAELSSIGGRGNTLCAIAKGGALRCWGGFQVTQAGPYTAVTVSGESACAAAKDRLDCFGSEAEGQLKVPEDLSVVNMADAGRTPDEVAAAKKRRAAALRDLLTKLPERDLPFTIDRATKVPVGRVTDDGFLPLLELKSFYYFFESNRYHNGFSLKAPEKKVRLVVMHDSTTTVLMSFNEDGRRIATLPLAKYALNEPDQTMFDCADVVEEVATESVIGADLKITTKTTTTLESLGRLKNQEKKIQNYCKVRLTTDEYAVSNSGSIEKLKSKSEVLYDKIADEACKGKWLRNPRDPSYTATDNFPEGCRKRLGH